MYSSNYPLQKIFRQIVLIVKFFSPNCTLRKIAFRQNVQRPMAQSLWLNLEATIGFDYFGAPEITGISHIQEFHKLKFIFFDILFSNKLEAEQASYVFVYLKTL